MSTHESMEPNKRLIELDVIRGFALFGILVVNMAYFSSPALYTGTKRYQESDLMNHATQLFIHLFFEFKFISIFSFLFGLGFAIFIHRMKKRERSPKYYYRRRIQFLLMIGLIHLLFIWYGDILVVYALLALVLPYFVHKKATVVLKWACWCLMLPPLLLSIVYIFSVVQPTVLQSAGLLIHNDHLVYQSMTHYKEGTFIAILGQRFTDIFTIYKAYLIMAPMIFGLFLLGMYVWKKGIIQNITGHINCLKRICQFSLVIGFPAALVSVWAGMNVEEILSPYYFIQYTTHFISGPALAVFYMSLLMLLFQRKVWQSVLRRLQPVGKMALTNYLLQSLICTTLFYSYGFGFYSSITVLNGFSLSIVIFTVQLLFSHLWLKRYSFGPLEWLWRKYTYQTRNNLENVKPNKPI